MNNTIDLLSFLKTDCAVMSARFAPYVEPFPTLSSSESRKRRPNIQLHTFNKDVLLKYLASDNLKALKESLIYSANQLCCKALLSEVAYDDGTSISAYTDGVTTINATGGFCGETFDKIDQRFAELDIDHYETPIAVGISGEEHRSLIHYAQIEPSRVVIENGSVKFVSGHPILLFGQNVDYPCLETKQGVRSCFAMTKGCLAYSAEWTSDEKQNTLELKLSALRLNGRQVCQVETTVGA